MTARAFDVGAAAAQAEVLDRMLAITTFTDTAAQLLSVERMTWPELVAKLENPPEYPRKHAAPLLKLARFGDKRTSKGSLRSDANLLEIEGIEGDYDAEVVGVDEAVTLLEKAGIRALVYASPSHSAERPRWRVLCPLAAPTTPERRAALVARLNGALGGILGGESFTASQAYYFGRVAGAEYHAVATFDDPTEGTCIDLLDELDAIAVGKSAGKSGTPPAANTAHAVFVDPRTVGDLRSALLFMRSDDRDLWQRMGHALKTLGDTGRGLWLEWSATSGKFHPANDASTWESFMPERTGYQAVFAEAQRRGWVNPMAGGANRTTTHANHPAGSSHQPGHEKAAASILEDGSLPARVLDLSQPLPEFESVPHIVERWIPAGEVTLLAGHGGGGKSFAALTVAVHVALGRSLGPLSVKQANVLFFSAEDGRRVLTLRLRKICAALNVDPAELAGKLHLLDVSDIDPALYRTQRSTFAGEPPECDTALIWALREMVESRGIGLSIVDNASDTFDADEIKRADVRRFVRGLRQHLAGGGRGVLLLAHVNKHAASSKASEDYSGSTAWHNSVRSRLSLTPGDSDLTVEHLKANLGPKAEPVRFEWIGGAPMVAGTVHNVGTEAVQALREQAARQDRATVVELVREFNARGEVISTSLHAPNGAFKVLRGEPGFPRSIRKAEALAAILREGERAGELVRETYQDAYRKQKERWVAPTAPSAPTPEVAALAAGSAEAAPTAPTPARGFKGVSAAQNRAVGVGAPDPRRDPSAAAGDTRDTDPGQRDIAGQTGHVPDKSRFVPGHLGHTPIGVSRCPAGGPDILVEVGN